MQFGRPPKLTAHQRREAVQRLAEGAVQADLARTYGVSQATISRLTGDRPWVSLRCSDCACPERLSHCVRLRAAMKSLPPGVSVELGRCVG